jgi:hypothetical protein
MSRRLTKRRLSRPLVADDSSIVFDYAVLDQPFLVMEARAEE